MRARAGRAPADLSRDERLNAVFDAARSGDLARAKPLALAALGQGLEHPVLLNLRALAFEEEGRFEDALADLRRAHVLAPADFGVLNACGLCLARLGRVQEALTCYDQTLVMRPDFGPAWFNRGWALESLGETVKAAQSYLRSVEIHPQNAQAWANLAHLAARRGDKEAVGGHAGRALALQPGHPTAVLALAQSELDDPPIAERRLRGLLASDPLGPFDRAMAVGLLADALDAQGRTVEAFAAYGESNTLFRTGSAARFEAPGAPALRDNLAWMADWAERPGPSLWRTAPPGRDGSGPAATHVFLMGFPRSGTTLIESVLTGHPDVVTLEERNTLDAAVVAFLGEPTDMARLAALDEADLRPWREGYWAEVRRHGVDPAGRIFIDKHPFNTMKLPLVLKLFPRAKIIFALRDPRDVVLSCWRRRFGLNPSTYAFLDLERTAQVYGLTMRLADRWRALQPSDEHRLVYENLIEDIEGEARAVCAFIGADWRPELLDFAGRGRRGEVASASSAQIARGLYSDGVGQWRRYRRELEPVMGMLAPWVRRFGYPAE